MLIDVRPATLEDARAIAEVHVTAWQEAYVHLAPAENLARLNVDQRERRWMELLTLSDSLTCVATADGRVVGFASSAPGRDPDSPRALELASIYVLANHYGTGAGQQLLDAVLGSQPAFLWVADDNPRARAFYERNGFRPDGTTKTGPLAGTDVLEVRLIR